jgi:predicted DNA-binding transcriptional regulator AlpA
MNVVFGMAERKVGTSELAHYLGMTEQWVYDQKALNRIPWSKQGKYLRFDLDEVDEYFAEKGFHPSRTAGRVHRLNGRKTVTRNG